MVVYTVAVGALATNCYIVADNTGTAAVIDPGGQPQRIQEVIRAHGLTVGAILLTHVHFDHIGAVDALAEGQDIPVYCHVDEVDALTDGRLNLSSLFSGEMTVDAVPTPITEGDVITVGALRFTVWHTPGHTVGSVCYVMEEHLFSGDTLFCESIGRTDFPGGSPGQMAQSLRRLFAVEGDKTVYPGHEERTTLSHERQYNPYAGM